MCLPRMPYYESTTALLRQRRSKDTYVKFPCTSFRTLLLGPLTFTGSAIGRGADAVNFVYISRIDPPVLQNLNMRLNASRRNRFKMKSSIVFIAPEAGHARRHLRGWKGERHRPITGL